MKPKKYDLLCPKDGYRMNFVAKGDWGKPYYWCRCGMRHGAHPNGKPLGKPADKETRVLRSKAHDLLGEIWDMDSVGTKSMGYRWLRRKTGTDHIGNLDKEDLNKLIKFLEDPHELT